MKRLVSREQCAGIADIAALALAAILPWSTSGTAIAAVIFIAASLGSLEWKSFSRVLARPVIYVPLAFVALFALGMVWATEIDWKARLHGLNPALRFCVLPLLFYHFEHSERGWQVAKAFFWSCALLMIASWLSWLMNIQMSRMPVGVPVKNYIDQGQEFSLCIAGGLWWLHRAIKARDYKPAAWIAALLLLFLLNLAFVVASRTALLMVPIFIIAFGIVHLGRKAAIALLIAVVVGSTLLWIASPYMRARISSISNEVHSYFSECAPISSMGERLLFWHKSVDFIGAAPVLGHGTGTVHHLFTEYAKTRLYPADVNVHENIFRERGVLLPKNQKICLHDVGYAVGNPHQQILSVGIQTGLVGIALLLALWFAHLRWFLPAMSAAGWLGFALVFQNIVTSLANSHLFDFTPGWIYVIGVGLAGGLLMQEKKAAAMASSVPLSGGASATV